MYLTRSLQLYVSHTLLPSGLLEAELFIFSKYSSQVQVVRVDPN